MIGVKRRGRRSKIKEQIHRSKVKDERSKVTGKGPGSARSWIISEPVGHSSSPDIYPLMNANFAIR
jgi:hypothetical protein